MKACSSKSKFGGTTLFTEVKMRRDDFPSYLTYLITEDMGFESLELGQKLCVWNEAGGVI